MGAFERSINGDANGDGHVDFADFLALASNFGRTGAWEDGDFTGNGIVTFEDFLILSANFDGQQPVVEPVTTSSDPVTAQATDDFFSRHNDEWTSNDEFATDSTGNSSAL